MVTMNSAQAEFDGDCTPSSCTRCGPFFVSFFWVQLDYDFVGLAEIWVFKPLTFPKSAASSVHVP
jgi:hypothetical protein